MLCSITVSVSERGLTALPSTAERRSSYVLELLYHTNRSAAPSPFISTGCMPKSVERDSTLLLKAKDVLPPLLAAR